VNPYIVIKRLHTEGRVDEGWWLAFKDRWIKDGGEIPGEVSDAFNLIVGNFGAGSQSDEKTKTA
jgi:hypothetical protein